MRIYILAPPGCGEISAGKGAKKIWRESDGGSGTAYYIVGDDDERSVLMAAGMLDSRYEHMRFVSSVQVLREEVLGRLHCGGRHG